MKTLILVNTLDRVSSFVYANHISFVSYNARKFPEDQFLFYSPHRQAIDTARNTAAMIALNQECDYLMFIDDDVLIPPNAFEILKDSDKDVVAGLVYLRGYPFNVMVFKEMPRSMVKVQNDKNETVEMEDPRLKLGYFNEIHQMAIDGVELVECTAVGFSCCLIKCDVIRAMEPPYFTTGPLNTEDVYFCLKAKKSLEPEPKIYCNTRVRCGHLLNPEPIEFDTRLLLTDFYDNLARKAQDILHDGKEEEPGGRNLDYIKRNLARL